MCKGVETLTECPMCGDTEKVPASIAELCIHPGCSDPPYGYGVLCQKHGCRRCGGVILADTEDWMRPVCYDCYFELGEPTKEPIWS